MKNLDWLFNWLKKYNKEDAQKEFFDLHDPFKLCKDLNLPKSRCEMLRWVRIYFNTDPLINELVTNNANAVIPQFELVTSSSKIREFYNNMAFNDSFNLYEFMKQFSLSFHKFGEAIPFGNLEEGKDGNWFWKNFILIEPELIEIKTDMMTGEKTFEMVPTCELKEAVQDSTRSKDFSPEIVAAIKEHRNIRLNSENVSIVARLTDPSATRGTSPIQCLFKVLVIMDKMRLEKKGTKDEWEYLKDQINLVLKTDPMVHRCTRGNFENWMTNRYFKPIAEKNGFRSKGKLILPKIRWIE